jgi:hypothetical protein
VDALDELIETSGHFMIYRQVRGSYLQPKLGQELKSPRIDRILVPKPQLIQQGWRHGPIGIECKKSGENIGRSIAQLLDYGRAAWLIEPTKGLWIMCQWLFLWPTPKTSGVLASILAQHRVGTAEPHCDGLRLASGESVIGRFDRYGLHIGAGTNGLKAGSR